MSHKAQRDFCKQVRERFPDHFKRVNAIDVGSLDINGNNRDLFRKSNYVGIDLHPGENVDVVGMAHEVMHTIKPKEVINYAWNPHLKRIEPDGRFDTIISTEALEHDRNWKTTLACIYNKLRPGGLMIITCASTGRPEHGTNQSKPEDSPGTRDHYENITIDMFSSVVPSDAFTDYHLEYRSGVCDLYFYGIKK